jgi:hypothetical protein
VAAVLAVGFGGSQTKTARELRIRVLAVLAGLSSCSVDFVDWTTLGRKNFAAEPHRPQTALSRGGYAGSWKSPPHLQSDNIRTAVPVW